MFLFPLRLSKTSDMVHSASGDLLPNRDVAPKMKHSSSAWSLQVPNPQSSPLDYGIWRWRTHSFQTEERMRRLISSGCRYARGAQQQKLLQRGPRSVACSIFVWLPGYTPTPACMLTLCARNLTQKYSTNGAQRPDRVYVNSFTFERLITPCD